MDDYSQPLCWILYFGLDYSYPHHDDLRCHWDLGFTFIDAPVPPSASIMGIWS